MDQCNERLCVCPRACMCVCTQANQRILPLLWGWSRKEPKEGKRCRGSIRTACDSAGAGTPVRRRQLWVLGSRDREWYWHLLGSTVVEATLVNGGGSLDLLVKSQSSNPQSSEL